MSAYPLTAIVILLMSVLQMWMAMGVGNRRRSSGVKAPAMTGNADLERAIRVHGNTLEQLAMFLPPMLICAGFVGDTMAASIGAVWVIGRVWYAIGYQQAANKREWGFLVTFLALAAALLVGGYGVILALMA